jgi:hypothetical protein
MQAIGPAHQAQNHRNCRKTEKGPSLRDACGPWTRSDSILRIRLRQQAWTSRQSGVP